MRPIEHSCRSEGESGDIDNVCILKLKKPQIRRLILNFQSANLRLIFLLLTPG